jgi:hypothetical protein
VLCSRASGARLREGNRVRLLKDAAQNYPAWLDAIGAARHTIHFEMSIIHEDDQDRLFADALIEKARQGVHVRLLYDWMGGFGKTSRAFWKRLSAGGVEVRLVEGLAAINTVMKTTKGKIIAIQNSPRATSGLLGAIVTASPSTQSPNPAADKTRLARLGRQKECLALCLALCSTWDFSGLDSSARGVAPWIGAGMPGRYGSCW